MSSCARCGGRTDDWIGACDSCDPSLRSRPTRVSSSEFRVYRGVALPRACVRCGEVVTRALRSPDDATLFVREHLLRQVFVVAKLVSLLFPGTFDRRQFLLLVPLCPRHVRRRRTLRWIGGALIAAVIPIVGIAIASPDESALFRSWFWAIGSSLTGVLLLAAASRDLRATEITDAWARFTGADERFLAALDRR